MNMEEKVPLDFFFINQEPDPRPINYSVYLRLSPHFPQKNKAPKVKRGLKTLRARTLGHFGQRVDESPMYKDDFGVS